MPTYLARFKKTQLPGGDSHDVMVTLEVVRDTDVLHLNDGDQFVTIETKVDLYE